MSAQPVDKRDWTAQEYLAWERQQRTRHEFFRGEVFAMDGATREHKLLVANITAELRNAVRKKPCEMYPLDMRVKVPAAGLYAYPDVSVICGEPEFEDGASDTLLNPLVLIEVLSDSSERYDRGKKFESYRSIPSLMDYVLVAQDHVLVEHFRRGEGGTWVLRELRAGGRVELSGPECGLEVNEIYLKVFDKPA
ncbi:MAG TPA: Uma2 family endonuclease [Polyangiaceae bacterium]|jgi:Uma2 family endonuclease|nr:Uma2 family endonuclease [Polyangiaceae bacterium]